MVVTLCHKKISIKSLTT